MKASPAPIPHDPLETKLSPADDRVRLSHWLPPQEGTVPRIRIGRRWINVLWVLPLGFSRGVIAVAVAQALRELPAVQDFLVRYPGAPPSAPRNTPDWPLRCGLAAYHATLVHGSDPDLALIAQHLERNAGAVPAQHQVDRRLAETQVAKRHLLQECRQPGLAQ